MLVSDALELLAQVVRLKEEVRHRFLWSLYAGSVLFLRDAGALPAQPSSAKLALVDFSYCFREERPGHDNLLYGVEQLERRMDEWLQRKVTLKVRESGGGAQLNLLKHGKRQTQTTLLFVRDAKNRSLLLAMKKRGLGAGKLRK